MQEYKCGFVSSRAIVVLANAVGVDVTLAPLCRYEFFNRTIAFHYGLQLFLLFTHYIQCPFYMVGCFVQSVLCALSIKHDVTSRASLFATNLPEATAYLNNMPRTCT